MKSALAILVLLLAEYAFAGELTKEEALGLWPTYVRTQQAPMAPNAILDRLNMYRAAADLPPVVLDPALVPASEACAQVLQDNPTWPISHYMPSTLTGWSKEAALAAARSCIDRGDDGAKAVADFIRDWGLSSLNAQVGHRRWLLLPELQAVGIGALAGTAAKPASACIYVFTPQSSLKKMVAWPPAGHVPMAWIPERWHYSEPGLDLSQALVYVNGKHCTTARTGAFVVFKPTLPFNTEDANTVEIKGAARPITYTVHRFRP